MFGLDGFLESEQDPCKLQTWHPSLLQVILPLLQLMDKLPDGPRGGFFPSSQPTNLATTESKGNRLASS